MNPGCRAPDALGAKLVTITMLVAGPVATV